MSTSLPTAPPPPDFGKSTKEAIDADIDTLPLRRNIDTAARFGKIYADGTVYSKQDYDYRVAAEQAKLDAARASGNAGEIAQATAALDSLAKKSDFSGAGDMDYAREAADLAAETNATTQRKQLLLRKELGAANAEQTRKELEAADPVAFKAREDLNKRLAEDLAKPKETITTNKSLTDASAAFGALAGKAPGNDGRLSELYGRADKISTASDDMGQLAEMKSLQSRIANSTGSASTLKGLMGKAAGDTRASDDLGALQGEAAGDSLNSEALLRLQAQAAAAGYAPDTLKQLAAQAATDPGAARQLLALARQSGQTQERTGSRLGDIYDQASRLRTEASDGTTEVLTRGLQSAAADFQLGGRLDEDSRRGLLDEVRSGQVSRGNFLGDAAAVVEATELGKAGEARKAQRLATLLDVQNRAFGQNSQLRGEGDRLTQQRLGTLASLQDQGFAQEKAFRAEQADLAQLTAADRARLRGETGALTGNASDIDQGLRKEQADYSATADASRSAKRGERAGYASTADGIRRAGRAEEAGYAKTLTAEQTERDASLAAIAQQIFGTGKSMRDETRGAEGAKLGLMQGLAEKDFAQNDTAFNTKLSALGQNVNVNNALDNADRAARAETTGLDQTRLANISAMVLGLPITNQFGALLDAGKGAVGYTPTNNAGGLTTDKGAGAAGTNFAAGNFATNANMWITKSNIAEKDNAGKNSLISGAAGTAAGAYV